MKIIYLCDRRACKTCSPECQYTTDISHAKNFEMRGEMAIEKLLSQEGEEEK